jgi:hypothetical protein
LLLKSITGAAGFKREDIRMLVDNHGHLWMRCERPITCNRWSWPISCEAYSGAAGSYSFREATHQAQDVDAVEATCSRAGTSTGGGTTCIHQAPVVAACCPEPDGGEEKQRLREAAGKMAEDRKEMVQEKATGHRAAC